jgi:hypothetical protein
MLNKSTTLGVWRNGNIAPRIHNLSTTLKQVFSFMAGSLYSQQNSHEYPQDTES